MEGFKINHTPNATKLPTVPGANGISQRIEQFYNLSQLKFHYGLELFYRTFIIVQICQSCKNRKIVMKRFRLYTKLILSQL